MITKFVMVAVLLSGLYPSAAQTVAETLDRSRLLTLADEEPPNAGAPSAATNEPATFKTVIPDILRDQKRIYWDFPKSVAHGKHLVPVIGFVAAVAGPSAVDQFEFPYFRRTTDLHGYNNVFSSTNTSLMIASVPIATYVVGLIRKDREVQGTAWRTGEAIADSAIAAEVLKVVTRRKRPEDIPLHGNFADTWFDSPTVSSGGFPSGHTIAAFSVATVMSRTYGRDHRWVPYVAYGVASAIGFSRITLSAHNVTDVLAGAALGYVISRFVVLERH